MRGRPEERHETHLSVVSVFADDVLKVLKPVRYPFVDLSTEQARRRECLAEVSHNQPWAPGVYLGVVDVSGDPPCEVDEGEPAVWMRRLPADRTLLALGDTLAVATLRALGRFLRARHDTLPRRPESSTPAAVWQRIDDNLSELGDALAGTHSALYARLCGAASGLRPQVESLLEERADRGQALHGDLRAEHVYALDEGFAVLDGVAFDEALASGDPLEDVAFLAMDLGATLGRWDLVDALWGGWGDSPTLLRRLYSGHRSLIRAKVSALAGNEPAVLRHLLHGLVHWDAGGPLLVGIGGLPGVGKSTLARALAEPAALQVLRTDVVRRELGPSDYSEAGRGAVYDALLARAREILSVGDRVVVDASFGREAWRLQLLDLGRELGIPVRLLFAHCDPDLARQRIDGRQGDASEADATVQRHAREAWEPLGVRSGTVASSVDTGSDDAVDAALRLLS